MNAVYARFDKEIEAPTNEAAALAFFMAAYFDQAQLSTDTATLDLLDHVGNACRALARLTDGVARASAEFGFQELATLPAAPADSEEG